MSTMPLYSPISGYGTQQNGWNFVQTPSGGTWSQTAASQATTPQTLGASTSTTGGGGGTSLNTAPNTSPDANAPQAPSMADIINNKWNDYNGYLDQIFNGLGGQAEGQNQIVNNQFQQGTNDLNTQLAQGNQLLGTQRERVNTTQASNLSNLADSLRNQFMTGNNLLGAAGAGDSSAANQYSYALTKMGNKNRGNIMAQNAEQMAQIDDREFQLRTTVDNEKNNLKLEKDNQIMQISQWLADAQNQIRQMKAQGALGRGEDIQAMATNALNMAMQKAQQAEQDFRNRNGMLEQWAMNNATNLATLKQNLAQVSGFQAQPGIFSGLNAQPVQSGYNQNMSLFGFGNREEDKKRI